MIKIIVIKLKLAMQYLSIEILHTFEKIPLVNNLTFTL